MGKRVTRAWSVNWGIRSKSHACIWGGNYTTLKKSSIFIKQALSGGLLKWST
jgi:hypothetical protein